MAHSITNCLLQIMFLGSCARSRLNEHDPFYRIVHSFVMLHSDVTKMFLTSQIEQEDTSSVYSSQMICLWIAIIFVTKCLYLCGANI